VVVCGKPGVGRWNGAPVYRRNPPPALCLHENPRFDIFRFPFRINAGTNRGKVEMRFDN
jgi:hypothetical protein